MPADSSRSMRTLMPTRRRGRTDTTSREEAVLRRFSMRLCTVVAGAGLMATAALGGPAHAAPAALDQESFESGFGASVPDTVGRACAWQITRSTDQAYDGKYSLAFYLDGRNDDGT